MLQIRLNKGPSLDGGSGVKSESVTVACPDHLVLADLPVAKGLGSATCAARAKTVGRRSRRQLGERVHFCVRCDFPIAIYGRLTPCEHVFCLDCARSDSMCYLCDERIQKIQTIKLMEGIFICAAPHCLKSFLKKNEFESHIHGSHGDLLQPNMKKEEANESDAYAVKPSAASESSVRAPQKPGFPPSSNPPLNDREERTREQTPLRPLMQPRDGGSQRPDGLNSQNRLPQQRFEGILDPPHYPPPVYYQQPPNFGGSMLPNRPPFGFPPFPSDGAPFYGTPMNYEVTRSDSSTDPGFSETHTHPWPSTSTSTSTSSVVPFEAMQTDKPLDPQARAAFFQGRNSSKALEPDSKGVLASMPPPPPPGPPPPHLLQQTTQSHDGNNYGWSQQNCDSFGGGL